MPSFCAVSNCELKYSHSENVSFHKFPLKNPKILAEWIKFTNRGSNWKPSRWNSICSRHFDKSDFREYLSRKCLKKDAIPSIVTKNNISYETYHISTGSPDDTRTLQSEQEQEQDLEHYAPPIVDNSKMSSGLLEMCRLCGDRTENITCNALRSLDDPEIDFLSRKCFPTVNIQSTIDQAGTVCSDCITQLKQFSDFIDKVLSYQRDSGLNENIDTFSANPNSLVNRNRMQCCTKASTPNPSTTMFIKQEPINVKQEIVEISNRRPFTVQLPTMSPTLCLNPFAESKKAKGFVQQEINLPKTEAGSTYCRACDRIFVNNFEFRSHDCSSADHGVDREQGNNCEIMEVITLNNPVSFIDLADDEIGPGIELRKLKTESFCEFERRERLEFEHAYAKRATNTNCNLKQEVVDSYNDNSQDGYDCNEQTVDTDEQHFNQNSYFEETATVCIDCPKCNQSFVSQELLDEHMSKMHPVKPKVCPLCGAEFKSSKEYLLHKSKMHSQRYQCKQCKQKFNTQTILRFHAQRCTGQSKDFCFSCRHCGKNLRSLAIMKRHLGICMGKLSELAMKEVQSNQLSKNIQNLVEQSHIRSRPFSHENLLAQPIEYASFSQAPVKPMEIDVTDARLLPLQDAINVDSSAQQSFKVVVDDSKFIFLNENKTTPDNELNESLSANFNGKFACDTCGQPYSTFVQLKQHKLEHDAERKFSCSLCPKTFKGISGLKQHISGYHYKIKPFSCSVCGYSYALKGDMQRCRHSKLKNQNTLKIM